MSGLIGKWKLTESNNLAGYLKAVGCSEETLAKVPFLETTGDNAPGHVSAIEGNDWTLDMYGGSGNLIVSQKITFGTESELTGYDGSKHKILTKLEGDKITMDGVSQPNFQVVQEASGNELTMTMKCGDAVCVRKYKKEA